MKPHTWFIALMLSVGVSAQPRLDLLLSDSDLIVVGRVQSIQPVSGDDRPSLQPRKPFQRWSSVHLCRVTLAIDLYIKKGPLAAEQPALEPFLMMPTAECIETDFVENLSELTSRSLWFLRMDNGRLRTTEDNRYTFRPLRELPSGTVQGMRKLADPIYQTAHLLLTPGVTTPIEQYGVSRSLVASDVARLSALIGWRGILEVFKDLYSNADPATKDHLCLAAADFGSCLPSARDAASRLGGLASLENSIPFLDPDIERASESANLQFLSASKSGLVTQYETEQKAQDWLTLYACGSSPRLRDASRKLLLEYFGIRPETLPCIPCESQSTRTNSR